MGCAATWAFVPIRGGFTLVDADRAAEFMRSKWRIGSAGYALKERLLHREAIGAGDDEPLLVDHINHDKLDNRRCNLRLVTRVQNSLNQKPRSGATSKFPGVSFNKHTGKWRASGSESRKSKYLGEFVTEAEAAEVAAEYRQKLWDGD